MADYGQEHLAKVMRGNQDRAEGMERARKYMRGMNTLASGGSFGGHRSAGQRGADDAQAMADSINKRRYEGND